METVGDLIRLAAGSCARRGDIFWIRNSVWRLGIFEHAKSIDHPGLVLTKLPNSEFQMAPGTSKPLRDKRFKPFALQHPQALNGQASTFFLNQPIPISERFFGANLGCLHPHDLARLNVVLPDPGMVE